MSIKNARYVGTAEESRKKAVKKPRLTLPKLLVALKDLEARVDKLEKAANEPIEIILPDTSGQIIVQDTVIHPPPVPSRNLASHKAEYQAWADNYLKKDHK